MDIEDLKRRMDGAVATLRTELAGLRTGRASASMLEPVTVEVYGASMPLNQVATISVAEPRMISVQVWDRTNVAPVDRAIRESNLGLNPMVEGQLLRIPIPELNEERRKELVKVAHKYAELARVAARNVRRDGMEAGRREEKDGELSQDEHRVLTEKVQKLTDQHITEIDALLAAKEAEILQI